ncbi:Peptidase S54, rhomboid, partial [Corchorus capsularis]
MGKGQPSPPPSSSDVESGPNHHKPHHHKAPPPHFSPPLRQPWVAWLVPLIFLADIVIFGATMYINNCPANSGPDECVLYDFLGRFSFEPRKYNPLFGPSPLTLKNLGGLDWKLVVERKQLWRLISCIWLHGGILHVAANMLSLLFTGVQMEQEFGFLRIGLLYLLSGFGGSLISALSAARKKQTLVSVGASGAIFGLLGAMLSDLFTNWTNYTNKCPALLNLVLVICLNLALGFLPHVDNSAHIGGFISGFLLGFILLVRPQFGYVSSKHIPAGYQLKHKKPKYKCYHNVFWVIALVLLIVG